MLFWLFTTLLIVEVAQVVGGDFRSCPEGYSTRDNRNCYKIFTHPLNRKDASSICQSEGGTLASIPSAFDNSYIVNEFLNKTAHGKAWLGITCENATLDSCKNDDNTHFGPYQIFVPGMYFGSNKCVYAHGGEWYPNVDCSAELPFICQLPTEKLLCPIGYDVWCGSCYRYVDYMDNTMDADAACAREGAHLVSIHSERENEYVRKLAQTKQAYVYEYMYIGLYVDDKQEKAWFDNSDFLFDNIRFDDAERGNCYIMALVNNVAANGTWIRSICDIVLPYMCKTAMQDIYAIDKEVLPQ